MEAGRDQSEIINRQVIHEISQHVLICFPGKRSSIAAASLDFTLSDSVSAFLLQNMQGLMICDSVVFHHLISDGLALCTAVMLYFPPLSVLTADPDSAALKVQNIQ